MADYPIEGLGWKTPLEVATKPNMDHIASKGRVGILKTIPDGMYPGSDVANLSILGYDPRKYYTGRGPLEAGAMGVQLGRMDTAFRCNLITERDGMLADYSAGHISDGEASQLIRAMNEFTRIGEFHAGIDYRHLFILRDCDPSIVSTPPHNITGQPIAEHMLKPSWDRTAEELNRLMLDSKEVLSKHPVNELRVQGGKNPANMVWLWGQGRRPALEKLEDKNGLTGAMIAEVNLIKGIGFYAGMSAPKVPGATGYYDTNYEGEAEYALRALETHDLVYVHVEAPDEAGHAGDVEMKVKTIEDLDRRLLGKILDGVPEGCKVAVLPDHPTPIEVRTHVPEPVPFAICAPHLPGDGLRFDEFAGRKGSLGSLEGEGFMKLLLKI